MHMNKTSNHLLPRMNAFDEHRMLAYLHELDQYNMYNNMYNHVYNHVQLYVQLYIQSYVQSCSRTFIYQFMGGQKHFRHLERYHISSFVVLVTMLFLVCNLLSFASMPLYVYTFNNFFLIDYVTL